MFISFFQVDLLKFENNRLKDEIMKMKKEYFERRRKEDALKENRDIGLNLD